MDCYAAIMGAVAGLGTGVNSSQVKILSHPLALASFLCANQGWAADAHPLPKLANLLEPRSVNLT